MVIKDVTIGKVTAITLAVFGRGSVVMTNNSLGNKKMLFIKTSLPAREIGTKDDSDANTLEQLSPDIIISFENRESFNVFKKFVNRIDKEYEEENNTKKGKP